MSPNPLDTAEVQVVVDQMRPLIEGDGAQLSLVDVDGPAGRVHLRVDLDDATCAECVMPPQALREVMTEFLARALPGFRTLELRDPREVTA